MIAPLLSNRKRREMEDLLNSAQRQFDPTETNAVAIMPDTALIIIDEPVDGGGTLRRLIRVTRERFPDGQIYATGLMTEADTKRPCFMGVEVNRHYFIVYVPDKRRFKLMTKPEMGAVNVFTGVKVCAESQVKPIRLLPYSLKSSSAA